ncbi:MAG: hypothetical protein ABI955_06960 [Nitrospirota bacterium]
MRGQTLTPQATKLGVLDLSVMPAVRTDFTIPELDGTSPGSFKFSPDGKRFYILAGGGGERSGGDKEGPSVRVRLVHADSNASSVDAPAGHPSRCDWYR